VAPEQIEKCGLALPREGKNDYYDRFRHRLVFPVVDPRGRIIAFGGRALGDEEPKYLNSPDTLIYQKGDSVFGLNLSRDNIKKQKTAVLVEGYFDMITPFEAGVNNIIASLGTALTPAQCKLVARYCENIVLAYDADAAGGIAAERSAELLKKEGLKVKIARLTGGKDPDEIIRKGGTEAFSQCLSSALPFLEFKIQRLLAQKNLNEIEARAAALREIAALLGREGDPFVRKEYAKLFAPVLKIDPEAMLAEIKRDTHWGNARRVTAKPDARGLEAEKNLIALAAQDRTALEELKANLSAEDFKLPEARAIAEILFTTEIAGENLSHFLLENLPDEKARGFLSRTILRHPPAEAARREEIVRDCLKTIKDEHNREKIADIKTAIKEAERAGETEKAAELLNSLKSEIYEKSVR
jgi:DNA primase